MPELPGLMQSQQDMSFLLNDLSLMKDAGGQTYRAPTLGLDVLYGAWVGQQMAYRQQLIGQVMDFAKNVEEVWGPVNHIVNEVFRRGIHWKRKFAQKCEWCQVEYAEEIEECEKCMKQSGGKDKGKLRSPDESQKRKFEPFLRDCNVWDQSFESVMKQLWVDVNIADDLFLYIVKEYKKMEDGTIRSKPIEIRRLNPALMEFDLDPEGLPKNTHYVCYIHRDLEVSGTSGQCSECDSDLMPTMYKYYYRGKSIFFLDSEIIHSSKFYSTETFGYSPILTLLHKILTIKGMDLNVFRYFYERKMPAAMMMVFTDDAESLRREREHIAAKMRQDPNYIPMVAVSTKQSRGRVDLVRLFHTLQEMDYLPVREEIRERIAAMWGVTPAWQGAPEAYGGLSSQTQQLTVMSRVVESDQRIIHEKIFPLVMEAFGITDWTLELPQPEEKAEATRISFAQQRISAANMLVQMGFKVKIKASESGLDDIEFTVSGEALTPQEQQQQMMGMGMGGDMGGAPGGDMGGGGFGESAPEAAGQGQNGFQPSQSLGLMEKSQMIMKQIEDRGFKFPVVKTVAPDMSFVIFDSIGNGMYKAIFNLGSLIEIEKYVSPRLHQHGGYPKHDINTPHNETGRQQRNENKMWEAEKPEMDVLEEV
jgi:hypothetical protein